MDIYIFVLARGSMSSSLLRHGIRSRYSYKSDQVGSRESRLVQSISGLDLVPANESAVDLGIAP